MARIGGRCVPEEVAVTRYSSAAADTGGWIEVSVVNPCPACGGTSECSLHEDGEFARCFNSVCDWPVVSGGWLHRIESRAVDMAATT